MRKCLLLLVLCMIVAGPSWAQVTRLLPATGERGKTGASQPLPQVIIGKRVLRLAPGGVIYDQQNRSIIHAHLPVAAEVFYTLDPRGDIQRIYILTDQEKARLAQAGKR